MGSDVETKLKELIKRSKKLGINIADLPAIKNHPKLIKITSKKTVVLVFTATLVIALLAYVIMFLMSQADGCLVDMPGELSKAFRPAESCEFCENVKEVKRISKTSPEEFEEHYAYSSTPVIVTDATVNWTALHVFDFWYFKEIYESAQKRNRPMNCQFFPYKSGFKTFYEALSIPEERVNYREGTEPWYFGWSNCNNQVAEILRQHYGRPYFLPRTSENNAVDWIFMGGVGLGAHMHIDNVRLPSWQAQIKGSKEWTLAPPPECYFVCTFMTATVNTGDIIVLDTNRWYHKTTVLPGEISVTIGAEYD